MTCVLCVPGYYLNSENKCVNLIDYIQIIPNCIEQKFSIGNIEFYIDYYNSENIDIYLDYSSRNYFYDYNYYNEIVNNIINPINTNCTICQEGYFMNKRLECEILSLDKCTLNYIQIANNSFDFINDCNEICANNNFPSIFLKFKIYSLDFDEETYKDLNDLNNYKSLYEITQIRDSYPDLGDETKNLISNIPFCYNISNEELKNKFGTCQRVIFNPINKSYQCLKCINGYEYNYEKQKCILIEYEPHEPQLYFPCPVENLGTNSSPIYSCESCGSDGWSYRYKTLITFEDGIKRCIFIPFIPLIGDCHEATVNFSYFYPLYNCTSCRNSDYLPFYSKYYQTHICQYVYGKVLKRKNITLNIFEKETSILANNGVCQSNYFTPDGENCYKCDNENVGMPGCNGECSFSPTRNYSILCQNGCKEGYLEVFPGVCEPCKGFDEGCIECYYNRSYYNSLEDFPGSIQCSSCEKGYVLSVQGKCIKCSTLINRCEECERVQDNFFFDYKCTKCPENYIFNSLFCERCLITGIIINDKCVMCYDSSKGGVDHCKYCLKNKEEKEALCKECFSEYILLISNNTCLFRESNDELKHFDSCLELKLEDGKYVCSRCKPKYSLLEIDNELKCTYTPTLFDSNFMRHYYDHNYYDVFGQNKQVFNTFVKNDYNYRPSIYLPCKESINLGTTENPLYSCSKCYNVFDNEKYDYFIYSDFINPSDYYLSNAAEIHSDNIYFSDFDKYFPTKIKSQIFNNSYCIQQNEDLINCTEATHTFSNGTEIYNCTKCFRGNVLFLKGNISNIINLYYCKYNGIYEDDDINDTKNETNLEITNETYLEVTNETNPELTNEINPGKTNETNPELTNETFPGKTNETNPELTNETFPGKTNETNPELTNEINHGKTNETNPELTNETNPELTNETFLEKTNETNPETEKESTNEKNNGEQNLIEHCLTYAPNNIYICLSCESNYEVNQFTGSCVEKTEFVPSVTWKDLFQLNMNSQKTINGRVIKGPSFTLRGITSSQINEGYAFIVYLIFRIRIGLRNLEETIKVPAICENSKEIEENDNDVNIVDYNCIGNQTIDDNLELVRIEGENTNNLIINNPDKTSSEYTTESLPNIFIIKNNNLENNIYRTSPINFYLQGTLKERDDLTNIKNISMNMNEINDKAICDFYKDDTTSTNFTCSLEINNNTQTTNLTFKDNEVTIGDKFIYLNSLNKIQFAYSNLGQSESSDSIDTGNKNETNSQRSYINRKKSSDHNTIIISVSIVAGVVVIGGLLVIWLYISKIKKAKTLNPESISQGIKASTNVDETGVTNINMIK